MFEKKKKEPTEAPVMETFVPKEKPIEFNDKAFSVVMSSKFIADNNKQTTFHLVQIDFDLETKTVGEIKEITTTTDRATVTDAFKLAVVRNKFFN